MSRYQSEAPEGLPTHTPKIRIRGVPDDSPIYAAAVDQFRGRLAVFHRKQQQQVAIGGNPQYKARTSWPGAKAVYHNNNGQETLTLDVSPELLQQVERFLPDLLDTEFGGYITFSIGRLSSDPVPASFTLWLNDAELLSGTFSSVDDAAFWAVVTFGKNALKYHSDRDSQNEVTQKFIQYPSPRYRDPDYIDFPGDGSGAVPYVKPHYFVFNIPGGVLGLNHMTFWDGANTPLLLDGASRSHGGGVIRFDDIGSSPLVIAGENRLRVTTSAGRDLSGDLQAEFFSRSTRRVIQSWRYSAEPGQTLIMNDQPVNLAASFTNNYGGGSHLDVAKWLDAFTTLDGFIVAPPASTPILRASNPATPVTELIIDLSK